MRKRSALQATPVGACLVLGVVLTGVRLPVVEAHDEQAMFAHVQIGVPGAVSRKCTVKVLKEERSSIGMHFFIRENH
jgi:hypothetical protein